MQEKVAYMRPKVAGPCASGSYVDWAALFLQCILVFLHPTLKTRSIITLVCR
jgi:hypothetical protein